MNLRADLDAFVHYHRIHGSLTADATEPARKAPSLGTGAVPFSTRSPRTVNWQELWDSSL